MVTLIDITTLPKGKRWLKIYGSDFSVCMPKSVPTAESED